jgi:hypothetical protein
VDRLVATVEQVLTSHRFRYAGERDLQAGIEQAFRAAGLDVVREATLGDAGTIDFVLGKLGIEIKVRGSRADVTRQVHRYLQHDDLSALLLVTTRAELARLPPVMSGKRVFTHHLTSGAW